jgi:valyl-tRNA synthetase
MLTTEDVSYNPKKYEEKIIEFWLSNNLFSPEYKKERKNTFTIPLPPPNANAPLHTGHVAGNTYQDIMGRYHRMIGDKVLLIPGKDHAGIQTEVVFEKELSKGSSSKNKIRKRDLGREEFVKQCLAFTLKNAKNATIQEQRIGLSADYSREKFSLDQNITRQVQETFIKMFNEDLIYRGKRIINWCSGCQTALADIDTEYKEEKGKLYYIKYGDLVVATTRPETIMADTALAVNPKDKRYKHLIGTTVLVKSVDGSGSNGSGSGGSGSVGEKELPIIGDFAVDENFGTGILKVTPGHSKEDFEIGERHNLPRISIIDNYSKLTYGKYKGMKVKDAREAVVSDLEKLDLIVKTEDIDHKIQICERCHTIIEPLLSYQWFMKTKDLAKRAILESEKKKLKIHPQRQEKNYLRWLENIEDWCISRQLWWGQRIPVYYCGGKKTEIDENGDLKEVILGCGKIIASIDKPKECPNCKSKNLVQEEDIFDTWFSSTQWPYTTLGGLEGLDFKTFYPTNVLETGRDILFFWVARMVIMGLYRTGKAPFSDVYLHGLILDKDGLKQSKSKGNGVNPMEMIDRFGTDSLRLALVSGVAPDQDMKLYEEKIKGFRNFINKVYNSSRFIFLKIEDLSPDDRKFIREHAGIYAAKTNMHMNQELQDLVKTVNRNIKTFEFGLAAFNLQNFYHHTFCDSYLEDMKSPENDNIESKAELIHTFYALIRLMHPFIPFITEALFQTLKEKGLIETEEISIMYEEFPKN